MLVLGRKEGQSIEAGELKVTVLEIRGNWVRLGFDAPKSVLIRRTEANGLLPVKEDEDEGEENPEQHPQPSRIVAAYGCHLCRGSECVDKECRKPVMKQFVCPACNSSHFGSRCDKIDGKIIVTEQQCHDEFGVGCKWRGMV